MSGTLCSLESLVSLPPDLRFVVRERGGRERTIEAHRYFLARASPVFRALLYSSWGGAAPAAGRCPQGQGCSNSTSGFSTSVRRAKQSMWITWWSHC